MTVELKEKIKEYYYKHHDGFTKLVEEDLKLYSKVLIIDCHSFPSIPLPCDQNQSNDRPDICIGVDSFHTPEYIVKTLVSEFEKRGYSIKTNDPFVGSIVPLKYYGKNKKVSSVMIEVNRKLYIDEMTGKSSEDYNKVKEDIKECINILLY